MSGPPNIFQGFLLWLKSFVELLPQLRHFWPTFRRIFASLRRWIREPRSHRRGGCCIDPITEYKRPDPLLYSQFFLMKQGLAVTWDNPDIQIYDGLTPVNSSNLAADHDYEVVVRVWNNSYYAPAANLPVFLTFLGFGVGTASQFIGKTYIDLGVKGSLHCPAFAKFKWHTPGAGGHYCLQARLDWPDDANPDNNLGQENTNIAQMHSPATFTFTARNEWGLTRRFELEADMYQLPKREPCPPKDETDKHSTEGLTRLAESQLRWAKALETQAYGHFPVNSEWKVTIEPDTFTLNPNQERSIQVKIEFANGNFNGKQPFNINCFASGPYQQRELIGGVTLIVEGG